MLEARFVFLLSDELLAEYRQVALRPAIVERHGLSEAEVDELLAEIVRNAAVREGEVADSRAAPDAEDQHLWNLLACERGSVLVTGDQRLLGAPVGEGRSISPRAFVEAW